MIILVEGVDKTGKTTLSNELATITGFEYRKHSTMHSSLDALVAAKNVMNGLSTKKNYVFDRFYFPSDLIYGPIVGGYSHSKYVMNEYHTQVLPLMQEHGIVMIHCTASDKVLAERFIRDEEEYATVDQILQLAAGYRKFVSECRFRYFTLDSTNTFPKEMLREATSTLEVMLR